MNKKNVIRLICVITLCFQSLWANEPQVIQQILNSEKNPENFQALTEMFELYNSIYANLPERLMQGEKLTIFLDPAHGKLPDQNWQGAVTHRLSCTYKPEEYYSIKICRELYKIFEKNPHINLISTPDFTEVMQGKSNIYKNINFYETTEFARKNHAFMIISEHLNNVKSLYKADGLTNQKGIYKTYNTDGTPYLVRITRLYNGFLTMFNNYDITGTSREYAKNIKIEMIDRKFTPNNWGHGCVPYEGFTYFTEYPMSIIFESAFICNKQEEKMLNSRRKCKKIAQAHYSALLVSLQNKWGVDLSGDEVKIITPKKHFDYVTMIKLEQAAMFYLKKKNIKKANEIIGYIDFLYAEKCPKEDLKFFTKKLGNIASESQKIYKQALSFEKKKHYRSAYRQIKESRRMLKHYPVFNSLYDSMENDYTRIRRKYYAKYVDGQEKEKKKVPVLGVEKTIILVMYPGYNLEEAIEDALFPLNEINKKKLLKNFSQAVVQKKVRRKKYSKQRKRYIYYWTKVNHQVEFKEGIYLVTLDQNWQVKKARRVGMVKLDPDKYQNQRYLENSYFVKEKK